MKQVILIILTGILGLLNINAFAQGCAGGIYLNPQTIRGENASMADSDIMELTKFVSITGISTTPFYSIKQRTELTGKIDVPVPPCWIYGNPVIGFGAGKNFAPLVINMEVISPAVLIIGDVGIEKFSKPKKLSTFTPDRQAEILSRLKKTTCFGMNSGVTTALVFGEKLCAIDQLIPKSGFGQSYLPQKAIFQWKPNKWVAVIMREKSAERENIEKRSGLSDEIRSAELIVVPVSTKSWGYGLYVHGSVDMDSRKKLTDIFTGIRNLSKGLQITLDTDDSPEFRAPSSDEITKMKVALTPYLEKK